MSRQKTAVITGGAGGLGRAVCSGLLADGWFVCILDLAGAALDEMSEMDRVTTFSCDITETADVARVCQAIQDARPSVDLVIYNAGVTQIGLFKTLDHNTHRHVFEVNYFGAVHVAAEMLQPLRESKGIHLAISSVAGFSPLLKRTAYAASKHAMDGFFKTLRSEEKSHGVDVLIAFPSFVATNVGKDAEDEKGTKRPGSASDGIDQMSAGEAAEVILRGVRLRKNTIPVGRVARVAWWLNRISPAFMARMMERNMKRGDP